MTLPSSNSRRYGPPMRRLALLTATAAALLGLAAPASAVTINNGTVTLGVNPQGDLNDLTANIGVTFNATGNDGTVSGCPCEGWGAGGVGPGVGGGAGAPFQGRANESDGNDGYRQVSFVNSPTSAVSIVDILDANGTPALRLRQDYHPSPSTPNLFELTTTIQNVSTIPISDVRYERIMDWDIEPTPTNEFVTIQRGSPPPSTLFYSDDNGFSDNYPFTFAADGDGPLDDTTVNANYVDKGPSDHGARFTFKFGTLGLGETRQFFQYYGAAGTEAAANAAVSAAALELFSYGQPNLQNTTDSTPCSAPISACAGPGKGQPNTFIWGFRAVGGRPIIPPTLTLTPKSGSGTVGGGTGVNASLHDEAGRPVPGAKIVFGVSGANSAGGAGTTDGNGNAGFGYTGANPGNDSIVACLDSNNNNACDGGEVADSASFSWAAQQVGGSQEPSPEPVLGKSVVAGAVGGTVKVKGKNGKFRTLGANESIPLGSTIDATKGRVRLTSAAGPAGQVQTADFYQGSFVITQTAGSKPITQLALAGSLRCSSSKPGKASAAARKKKVRRLWGDGHGRFRTKGKRAAATVRGTKWLTEDRCDSTKVTVKRGVVLVRDFVKKKNVVVKKGHSYVARAKKKKK
jgi:hypothetical protein